MEDLPNVERLSDICRVCLEKPRKIYPLVGPILNVDVDVSTMIVYCTGEDLELDNEDLPKGVCIPCFRTIRIAYNFIRDFKETNKKLLLELKESLKTKQENKFQPNLGNIFADDEESSDHVVQEELVNEVALMKCEKESDYIENVFINTDDGMEATEKLEDIEHVEFEEAHTEENIKEEPSEKEEFHQPPKRKKSSIIVYKCPICPKRATKFEFMFVPHLYTHQNEEFTCSKCASSTKMNVDDYVAHFKRFHMYQCDICDKSFSKKRTHYNHMKSHEANKTYICSYENCTKSFLTPWSLKKHFNTHSKSAMYICSKCGRKFNTYDTFRYHMKTHDGKRSYLCPQCGRSFLQSVHLKDHMWKHRGVKQFRCNKCEKSYTSVTQLKKHLRKYCGLDESNVERRKWPLDDH